MNSFNAQFFDENGSQNVTLEDVQALNELLQKKNSLRYFIGRGCDEETADQLETIYYNLGELPDVPSVFDNLPVFPLSEDYHKDEELKKDSVKKLLLPVGAATAVCTLFYLLFHWDFLLIPCVVGVLATFFFGNKYSVANKFFVQKKDIYDRTVEMHRASIKAFETALTNYEDEKARGFASAKDYGAEYRKAFHESVVCVMNADKKKDRALEELDAVEQAIDGYDFAPESYHEYIPTVYDLMRSGRADSYKEALNMAIEEEERRLEAARIEAEEKRRTALLERQLEEERRHNEQMEREAEMARKQAQDMEYQRMRAEQKAADKARLEQQSADREARSRAMERCNKCANHDACGRNRGVPNCGAFVAKRF